MRISLTPRSPWPQGAQTGGGISEPSHHLLKGTCEQKWIRNELDPVQLSFSSSGETSRTADSVHTGPTAHLLSKTGGPGPPSTHSRKDLYGYPAVLRKHEHKSIIWTVDDHLIESFITGLLSHWLVCRQMSEIVQETIIFLTLRFKIEYGTFVRLISFQWKCHRQTWISVNSSGHSWNMF